jgi:hypothetical protein
MNGKEGIHCFVPHDLFLLHGLFLCRFIKISEQKFKNKNLKIPGIKVTKIQEQKLQKCGK